MTKYHATTKEKEMNLDELTIGQVKAIQGLLLGKEPPKKELIGEYVIVRCQAAGVHAGYLVDYDGCNVTLRDSRRLWSWLCAEKQHSLSGVACAGIAAGGSKIPAPIGTLLLSDACEILSTTAKCEQSIREAPIYEVD